MRSSTWVLGVAVVLAQFAPLPPLGDAAAAEDLTLRNSGFEDGAVGEAPPGWFVPPVIRSNGYEILLSDSDPASGKQCVALSFAGRGAPMGFGNVLQSFDAVALRGKTIRLTSRLRASGGGRAQMWLRVDCDGDKMGLFDNMDDRPVTTTAWTDAEIVGEVDADAQSVVFGVMLNGRGTAGADDFRFSVLDHAEKPLVEPPRPLTDTGLANLTAFARLFGYVRHFHPSDEAAAADWNAMAIAGVRLVESAKDPAELATALSTVFAPLAPTLRVAAATGRPAAVLPVGAEAVLAWRHRGFGNGAVRSAYTSTRERTPLVDGKVPSMAADPASPFEADLGGGVKAWVPLAVFADAKGSLPRGKAAKTKPARATANDRGTRLADVVIAWNVFQHFYPYFDVVAADWPAELATALRRAATDSGEVAFLHTLRRLVAALHDGHGSVSGVFDGRGASLPLRWDWVEDKLVVTSMLPGVDPRLVRGTVVTTIDGRPAAEVLAAEEEEISGATPQYLRYISLATLATGVHGTRRKLALRPPSGDPFELELTVVRNGQPSDEVRPDRIANLAEGIEYVDVDRVTTEEFLAALPRLTKARGVVIDFRGYPSQLDAFEFFGHLIDKPVDSARWMVPVLTQPDRRDMTFDRGGWSVPPLAPRITAKLVFLTYGGAISYAETCMGIVENYHLGEIVGGPTAGTNGNINPFLLPGGYRVSWTGMQVLKHDGSRHHGVGILPTVPVARTIHGVAAGRDEILDRAVELLRK